MKTQYRITPTELRCNKDTLCEKTSDYMIALADVEFKVAKITKKYKDTLKTLQMQEDEIKSLRIAIAKQWEDRYKEMQQQLEIDQLRSQVNELTDFMKHYESIFKEIEAEHLIGKEIETEIEQISRLRIQSASSDFIKKVLFLTEDEYEQMSSD